MFCLNKVVKPEDVKLLARKVPSLQQDLTAFIEKPLLTGANEANGHSGDGNFEKTKAPRMFKATNKRVEE